jgi:hypothetical protein
MRKSVLLLASVTVGVLLVSEAAIAAVNIG